MAYLDRLIRERFRAGQPIAMEEDPFLHLIQQGQKARAEGRQSSFARAMQDYQRDIDGRALSARRKEYRP